VDERRPEPVSANPARPAASAAQLVRDAYGAYVQHAVHCADCRSINHGACSVAETLWEAYREVRRKAQVTGP
jgi:hypothetical protein